MRVLLIGGTGLISTGITRLLLEAGHDVVHFNRGQRAQEGVDGVRTLIGDRKDYDAFDRIVGDEIAAHGAFDAVMEMIGFTPGDAKSVVRTFAGRCPHVIFCSTVDVYQKPAARYPIVEDAAYDRTTPWTYASDKVLCEEILFDAHRRGDFALTVIRPAHTYGEGSGLVHSLGGSLSYFYRLRRGKPIVVHGDGSSLWASCHRDDIARAFVNALGNAAAFGKGYHTTSPEWLPWREYHRVVAAAIGAPEPEFVCIPTGLLANAAPQRCFIDAVNFQYNNIFDNTAAKRDLGFEYTVPLADGARRIYQWLEDREKIPDFDRDPLEDRLIAAWKNAQATFLETMGHKWYELSY